MPKIISAGENLVLSLLNPSHHLPTNRIERCWNSKFQFITSLSTHVHPGPILQAAKNLNKSIFYLGGLRCPERCPILFKQVFCMFSGLGAPQNFVSYHKRRGYHISQYGILPPKGGNRAVVPILTQLPPGHAHPNWYQISIPIFCQGTPEVKGHIVLKYKLWELRGN